MTTMFRFPIAERLVTLATRRKVTIVTAESCTAGMVASAIADVAGASAVLDRGFVTYSNVAKTESLGVPADLIDRAGAVSEGVAARMADGAIQRSLAHVAVAITGIAGPGGGSAEKPVGTVWMAIAHRGGGISTHHYRFGGDRNEVRALATKAALDLLLTALPSDTRIDAG